MISRGLMQDRRNFIDNSLELRLSCIDIWHIFIFMLIECYGMKLVYKIHIRVRTRTSSKWNDLSIHWQKHDDVIKWKHFPRYWPFVRGIHRSPVNSPHKGQWRGALMFSLICVWINGWVNNRGAGDLWRYRPHHDVTVMSVVNSEVKI